MKARIISRFSPVLLAGAVLLADGSRAALIEGFTVIANKDVPVARLNAAELKDIYTGKTARWKNGQNVVIALLANSNDAALKKVSGMDAGQFKTYWQRRAMSKRGQPPKNAKDATSLVALVAHTKGAIALVPAYAGLIGVKVIEVK
jgi:ABC-type phosphate transport system substrate-binding protein